jgi:type I restriction enzyme S subunit
MLFDTQKGKIPSEIHPEALPDSIPYVSMEYLREGTGSQHVIPEQGSVIIEEDDMMILWDGSNAGEVLKSKYGILSSTAAKISPKNDECRDFDFFSLKSMESLIKSGNTGMGIPHVGGDFLKELCLPRPRLDEKKKIAQFLNHRTEIIHSGITRLKQKLLILEEKRSTLITQAVTKGLNPDVPVKISGVRGLDQIPAHWDLSQLRWIKKPSSSITYGIVQAGPDVDGGIPYIRVSDMSGEVLPKTGYKRTSEEIDNSYSRSRVLPGDLVITIRASIGKTLIVPEYLIRANLTQGTAKLSVKEGISNEFVFWALQSQPSLEELWNQSKGATFKEITLEVLRKHWIVLPPYEEQLIIADYINEQTQMVDISKKLIQEKIVLLEEYRTSLISAAVTGKIDLRSL